MPLPVLVPVNRLDRAKGRLAEVLSADERRTLALITLDTVLRAIAEAGLEPLLLTADEDVARRFARSATLLPERTDLTGLNAQLTSAVDDRREVLILHADLPLTSGGALRELVAAAPPADSVTLVKSRDGGTNAMLLRPPGRFALAYGSGSFAKHAASAEVATMSVTVHRSPALSLDLDTADDLLLLLTMDPHNRSDTATFLRPLDLPARCAAARAPRAGAGGARRPGDLPA